MTPAESLRDDLVLRIEERRFAAHGLHVLVGDHAAEHAWSPAARRDIHSVSKGVCVLAAGFAVDEGAIDLDEPIRRRTGSVGLGEGTGEVTLRQLLTMTSGVDLPWSPTLLTDWPDLAVEFLGRPTRGRRFQYSDASTYTAMRLLALAVGDIGEYVQRRLLTPLGVEDAHWERCPNGHIAGGGGLALRTEEMARIGQFIRDGGAWRGRQLLAPRWAEAMHSDWVRAGDEPGYERYAMAGWDGFGRSWRLHGAYGQLIVLDGESVVTVTADDHHGADGLARYVAEALSRR